MHAARGETGYVPGENLCHYVTRPFDKYAEDDGYLVLKEGQVVFVEYIGCDGHEGGWLFGYKSGSENHHGWFPQSSIEKISPPPPPVPPNTTSRATPSPLRNVPSYALNGCDKERQRCMALDSFARAATPPPDDEEIFQRQITPPPDDDDDVCAASASKDCPWRFGDVLTFKLSMQDLQGPGLKLKLQAISDFTLGPVQLQMSRRQDVGEACVDLRRRALPFCGQKRSEVWESPVLLVPLSHMRGGLFGGSAQLGEAVATVAVSFLVDTDPETILAATEAPSLEQVRADLAERAEGFMRQVYEIPTPLGWFNFESQGQEEVTGLRTMTPNETMEASERARERSDQVPHDPGLILSPDVQPEGWIRRKGPHGRYHWHHRSLGLAPWELEEPSAELPKSAQGAGAKTRANAPSLPRVAEDSPLSPSFD